MANTQTGGGKPAPKTAPKAAAAPAAPASNKSIVDPKYRDRYKTPDWLGGVVAGFATKTKKVTKTEGDGEGKTTKTVDVPDGVDVDKVFALAVANNLDVKKFEAQRDSHGFGGRIRMTVRNMLQKVAKQRHGIFVPNAGGTPVWTPAPADWLTSKDAPDKPTHNRDGSKIAVEKPAKADAKTADAKDETAKG